MVMMMFLLLIATLFATTSSQAALVSKQNAWSLQGHPPLRRNLAQQDGEVNTDEHVVNLNFQAISDLFQAGARDETTTPVIMTFELPDNLGTIQCTMLESSLLHPDLALELPTQVVRSGTCSDGRKVLLSFLFGETGSFSATFTIPGTMDWLYVDYEQGIDKYVLYQKGKRSTSATPQEFNCGSRPSSDEIQHRHDVEPTPFIGGMFRIAVAGNREFCAFTGTTKAACMNAIIIVMSRVNGIYMRELGVYFQLIPGNHKLLCVAGDLQYCDMLPNTDGSAVLVAASAFMAKRGVAFEKYDIGHVFTTGSGGIAGLGVLCTERKAAGTTGNPSPVGDSFSVDYVAHELGHQMAGEHSMKDCRRDGNEAIDAAVEPGSGLTIMAYAGICGSRNLQPHSDPYFHSINLPVMREFVTKQLEQCGTRIAIPPPRPSIDVDQEHTCNIPLGNNFQLHAKATTPGFYQWEHVDLGFDAYEDLAIARFRSRPPMWEIGTRFFPNLYYLSNKLTSTYPYEFFEQLPRKETSMTFRILVRSHFDWEADNSQIAPAEFGDFAHRDVMVNFRAKMQKLEFTEQTRSLLSRVQAGSNQVLRWIPGGNSSKVQVMVMLNNLRSSSDFKAQWIPVTGMVANTGSASVVIPQVSSSANVSVNYMIRTMNDDCFAFDFVANCTLITKPGMTLAPTSKAPTAAPSQPTFQYTFSPVVPTSLRPTAFPTQSSVVTKSPTRTSGPVFVTNEPTEQFLYTPCVNCPKKFKCGAATNSVQYQFRAPPNANEFVYSFSTFNPFTSSNMCDDTVLQIKNMCNDDAGGTRFSRVTLSLQPNELVTAFVGSWGNLCAPGTTVALTVNAVKSLPTGSAAPVVQSLDQVCEVGKANCALKPCMGATKFALYSFTPKQTGNYLFTTANADTTCADTVLVGKNGACSDDSFQGALRAEMSYNLVANEGESIMVGSYGDACASSQTVSIQVSPPRMVIGLGVPQSVKFASPHRICQVGTFGCSPIECFGATEFVAFLFTPRTDVYEFTTQLGGTCVQPVMVIGNRCTKDGVMQVQDSNPLEPIIVFVGGVDNSCKNKFVSMTASIPIPGAG